MDLAPFLIITVLLLCTYLRLVNFSNRFTAFTKRFNELNPPMVFICTAATRPKSAPIGTMIHETDTERKMIMTKNGWFYLCGDKWEKLRLPNQNA